MNSVGAGAGQGASRVPASTGKTCGTDDAKLPAHVVRLDAAALDAVPMDSVAHVDVIPWKTGRVGVVDALDDRPEPASRAAAAPKSAEKASCGEGCGCAAAAPVATASASAGSATDAAKDPAKMERAAKARFASLSALLGIDERHAASDAAATSGPAVSVVGPKPKLKKVDPKRPGSGIPARRVIRVLVWVRRVSQVSFLALFLYFLVQTAFRGSFAASADTVVRLPLPVEAFLLADPFVAAMTFLSTHTVYRGLFWSVGLLALTLVVGRVFCGWICPFGTLHHFFGWLLPSRRGRGGSRVEANKTHGYQRAKYYLLYAFLVAGVFGSAIGGLFDPICIAVRSIGLGVIPALQYVMGRGLGGVQSVPLRPVQGAADSAQSFPRHERLAVAPVLLPPDVVHRLFARGGALREPLHSALLVPHPLSSRRVPRCLLPLRALRHGEGSLEVHRLQPLPRQLPGR